MLAPNPTVFNEELMDVRDKYVSDKNRAKVEPTYTSIDDSLFTDISEYHSNTKDDRSNPTMVKSYRKFLDETKEQYQYLIAAGYTIEPWMEQGEPYGVDSNAVREDIINNKHLYYLRSKSATGDGSGTDTAEVIKSHNNVGGLPEDMTFKLIEPLRDLFKDEVRAVGLEVGLPDHLVWRNHFLVRDWLLEF
jgi:hypothetical protein